MDTLENLDELTTNRILPWNTSSFSVSKLSRIQRDTVSRCSDLLLHQKLQTASYFSHTTALELLGVELPRLRPPQQMSPRYHYDLDAVHVCVKDASQRSHRQAATAHLWNHEFSAEAVAGKLFTVPPPTAWAQMAPYVALEDLVALGDSMMRHDPLLHSSTHHEFEEFLAKTGGFPGRRSCIEALKYMSENTDSIQESLLRFAIRQRGFDQPVSNFRVVDAEFAQSFLLDMAWPESKVGAEYNGPQHEGTAQRQRDEYKLSRLDQLGWRIATAKSTTLTNPIHMDMFITELLACFSQATRK